MTLSGKVVVVTGSTRGIGRAIAIACVAEGARVYVSSRTPEAVNETLAVLSAAGAEVDGMACDVAEAG